MWKRKVAAASSYAYCHEKRRIGPVQRQAVSTQIDRRVKILEMADGSTLLKRITKLKI